MAPLSRQSDFYVPETQEHNNDSLNSTLDTTQTDDSGDESRSQYEPSLSLSRGPDLSQSETDASGREASVCLTEDSITQEREVCGEMEKGKDSDEDSASSFEEVKMTESMQDIVKNGKVGEE